MELRSLRVKLKRVCRYSISTFSITANVFPSVFSEFLLWEYKIERFLKVLYFASEYIRDTHVKDIARQLDISTKSFLFLHEYTVFLNRPLNSYSELPRSGIPGRSVKTLTTVTLVLL